MRASSLLINTTRERPAEAELTSHALMLRAGMLRQLASGIFSWLPLGLRTVRRIEQIVREEMNRAGAAEIMMPAVQPAELWQESGRWQIYGPELLRLEDRHGRAYCVGPTHEEVVTDIARACVRSWRQLPCNLYQIQTKFRDEVRPRFGVMRSREFVMKDAYSFDADAAGAKRSYQIMRDAYVRIFDRIGLDYRVVEADVGAIGGSFSEEFLALADCGEAVIGYTDGDYATNLEQVPCSPPAAAQRPDPGEKMEEFATPGVATIDELDQFVGGIDPGRSIKTMIVTGEAGSAALILPGNAELSLAKASRLEQVGFGAALAEDDFVRKTVGAGFGSLGPVGMSLPVIADASLASAADFFCGANRDGYHLRGVNFGRDLPEPRFADLRMAVAGEVAPDGRPLKLRRGIEVGQIFNLGTKYSQAMAARIEGDDNVLRPMVMGCYGIGITRIVAAAIEQFNDEAGIVFPESIAPFIVAVLPLGKSPEVMQAAESLYAALNESGIDCLLEDRGLRAGAAFADLDLLGIPHRLVVSERSLAAGKVEHKARHTGAVSMLEMADAPAQVRAMLAAKKP
ncbi:MAG: proline--tRNA ligase [Betaproteobacteria bacterium]|nr:proline--tRNA ligase [Betaproteobacteria bacterium]